MFSSSGHSKVLIFNTTGDRDSKKLLNILREQNHFEQVCFVPNISTTESAQRSDNYSVHLSQQLQKARMHNENWQSLCQAAGQPGNSQVFESVLDSFKYLQRTLCKEGGLQQLDVLITGSLHLIGATVLALNEFKLDLE